MSLNPGTPLHWIDTTILLRLGAAAVPCRPLGRDRALKGRDAACGAGQWPRPGGFEQGRVLR